MKTIALDEISQAVAGRIRGAPSTPIDFVCDDTRNMKPISLYVAIRGDRHDGHAFIPQAAASGAVAAMVEAEPPVIPPGLALVVVEDTRKAFGQLAAHVRRSLRGPVIAVGGSNGKTGTKHLIDSALCKSVRGTFSPKSYNNDIGVPRAVFAAGPDDDYTILELGTNHHGELRVLTHIAQPDVAVITCCAPEHLEGLGDMDGVRREEASLIEGIRPGGLLIINGDDPLLLDAVKGFPGRRITFGSKQTNSLYPTEVRCDFDGLRFRLNGRAEYFVPMLGKHVAVNALAAIAVAREFGLSEQRIAESLAVAHGPEMRLELQRVRGITLLNDAYNANPGSMKSALDTLAQLPADARRIAVLGDMRELGDASDAMHREVGQHAAACRPDLLICVGEKARFIGEQARAAGMPQAKVAVFVNTAAAAEAVPNMLSSGDLVLIKASRGMKLEAIANAVLATTDQSRKAAS